MTSRVRDRQISLMQFADRIRGLGLQLPAVVLLEAGRPFMFVAAQLVWLAQPVLALLMPRNALAEAAEILEDPVSLSELIELLGPESSENPGGA